MQNDILLAMGLLVTCMTYVLFMPGVLREIITGNQLEFSSYQKVSNQVSTIFGWECLFFFQNHLSSKREFSSNV
jgi:hypothetical protein